MSDNEVISVSAAPWVQKAMRVVAVPLATLFIGMAGGKLSSDSVLVSEMASVKQQLASMDTKLDALAETKTEVAVMTRRVDMIERVADRAEECCLNRKFSTRNR